MVRNNLGVNLTVPMLAALAAGHRLLGSGAMRLAAVPWPLHFRPSRAMLGPNANGTAHHWARSLRIAETEAKKASNFPSCIAPIPGYP